MRERNWGSINNGATFEALARTLVFFEDSEASLFGRPGKDGGQDMRSGDDKRVFQAKYNQDASASKAIRAAKEDARKIAVYRQPGHGCYDQWQGVERWRLVTNALFNARDQQRWKAEVVPLFKDLDLTVDYWSQSNLDALLDRHPEVDRSFFQNEIRVLLTLPEAYDRLVQEEPFLCRDELADFTGREHELEAVKDFISSDYHFLVIEGAGGVGKTRLLYEAGRKVAESGTWQVFLANIASMSMTGAWFDAIVPERPTLLLVDEPGDKALLQVLMEQLGGRAGRTRMWKVMVAVRSAKDPVLAFLSSPRVCKHVDRRPLDTLSRGSAEGMCYSLLRSGPLGNADDARLKHVAGDLAHRFSGNPVWMTMAVHLLETHQDLTRIPEAAQDLAEEYLREIIDSQDEAFREMVRPLLRWVALVGPVNRRDATMVELLRRGSGMPSDRAVRDLLSTLVGCRVLVQRGARNRFVEIQPDVIRDHILRDWLTVDTNVGDDSLEPSGDAKDLIKGVLTAIRQGNTCAPDRSILTSLARTEFILRMAGRPVALLNPFFDGLYGILDEVGAVRRMAITDMLIGLAPFRPVETVEFSKTMRKPIPTERIESPFGSREVGHDDVVRGLAWLVYHAVPGAASAGEREQVLEELCRLAELEADIDARLEREPANDGKRAAQLIKRTLEGEPSVPHDFEDAARAVAARQLERVAHQPPTKAQAVMLRALLDPAVSVERRQAWVDGYTFRVRRFLVTEGHLAWETRQSLLARVKDLLASDSTPRETRLVLWRVFVEAHQSVIRCRGQEFQGFYEDMRPELLDNLKWSYGVLSGRDTGLNEFRALRDVWEWHYRFDDDEELKQAARGLEDLYLRNSLAREFEPLFNPHEWESTKERIKEKAAGLADSGSSDQILAFIRRAEEYLGKNNFHRVVHIARILGSHASTKKAVQDFVRESLADEKAPDTVLRFGYAVAVGWVEAVREPTDPEAAYGVVQELLGACSSDERRLDLLAGVYGGYPPQLRSGDLSEVEHEYIRSWGQLFVQKGRGPDFVRMVGWTLNHDWRSFRNVLEGLLEDIPADELTTAVGALIDTVYWAICKGDSTKAPDELGPWLLNQLMRLPNLPSRNDAMHWLLKEIVKQVGRVPLSWLPGALKKRWDLECTQGCQKFCAMSYKAGWGDLVARISADTADNPEDKRAIRDLVSLLAGDEGTISFYLPELLRDIDPGGYLVPVEIADRIRAAGGTEEILRLAEIGGHYELGSEEWRTIAGPVMEHAAESTREKYSLYHSLAGKGISTWSGIPGEVPSHFITAVDSARRLLEAEEDDSFTPFWEWHLKRAEAELREQEEHAKEERGE